jgi:hypothetical protein
VCASTPSRASWTARGNSGGPRGEEPLASEAGTPTRCDRPLGSLACSARAVADLGCRGRAPAERRGARRAELAKIAPGRDALPLRCPRPAISLNPAESVSPRDGSSGDRGHEPLQWRSLRRP